MSLNNPRALISQNIKTKKKETVFKYKNCFTNFLNPKNKLRLKNKEKKKKICCWP